MAKSKKRGKPKAKKTNKKAPSKSTETPKSAAPETEASAEPARDDASDITALREENELLKKRLEAATSDFSDSEKKSKDGAGLKYTEEELRMHVGGMERACREEAERAIAATANQAREKIDAQRDQIRGLKARVEFLEGKNKGKAKVFTEAEVLELVNKTERACRKEAEKALEETGEKAKLEIRKWKREARRLEAVAKAYKEGSGSGSFGSGSGAVARTRIISAPPEVPEKPSRPKGVARTQMIKAPTE
ncbi:MAG: hypothetical protein ACYS22_16370 [Planctomycetota bacterium]|jgi:hypothetical protein